MELNKEQLIRPEHGKGFRVVGWILRVLFGLVFIFSGFVKAIDPLGSTYKITDYLDAMGLASFATIALPAAIVLCAVELTIGLSMVTGVRVKVSGILGLIFMLVMTPLTLWIALKNPVSDCGCFGDALVLSNWATFGKNVVLLVMIITIVYLNTYFRNYLKPVASWLIFIGFFLLSVVLSLVSLRHLPCIDFRPYKVGNKLETLMTIPDDAPVDKYKTTYIYEKDGVQQEFDESNYPWNDSTWTFVDQTSVLVEKGYVPPIHDFNLIEIESGDDVTYDVLSAEDAYLVVMYDIQKARTDDIDAINNLYNKVKGKAVFYGLSASLEEEIYSFADENSMEFPFCQVDPITLKTIVRANPGVVHLKNGVVVEKKNARDLK